MFRKRRERRAEELKRSETVTQLMAEARTQDDFAQKEFDSPTGIRELYEHHERHAHQCRVKALCIHLGIERA